MRFIKFIQCITLGSCVMVGSAFAQELKLVVPFPAGGPLDYVARIMAPELKEILGMPVIIQNLSGAGGTIGTRQVAQSAPDGHTILLGTLGSQVVAPALSGETGYHPAKSFDTLAMPGKIQLALVVRPDFPAKNLQELIDMARNGTKLDYGSAGVGTTTHIAAETLNAVVGGKLNHVPYRGGGPALVDLIGGHIALFAGDLGTLAAQLEAGAIRPLAVLDTKRSPQIPDTPTTAELGYPEVVMNNWYGYVAPAGLDPEVRKRLESALLTVLKDPKISEQLVRAGVTDPVGAAEFETILEAEANRWPAFLKERGITP